MPADDQKKKARAEFATRLFFLTMLVVGVTSLVLIAYVTWQNSQRGKENHELLTTVQDCTQVGGDCYQRGQAQTASVVAGITTSQQQAAAAGATCTIQLQLSGHRVTYPSVYRCIVRTTHSSERKR